MDRKWVHEEQEVGISWTGSGSQNGQEVVPSGTGSGSQNEQEVGPRGTKSGSLRDRKRPSHTQEVGP